MDGWIIRVIGTAAAVLALVWTVTWTVAKYRRDCQWTRHEHAYRSGLTAADTVDDLVAQVVERPHDRIDLDQADVVGIRRDWSRLARKTENGWKFEAVHIRRIDERLRQLDTADDGDDPDWKATQAKAAVRIQTDLPQARREIDRQWGRGRPG